MVHGLAFILALTSAPCSMTQGTLPVFTALSPPYNATVEAGPMTVQIRARSKILANPWMLVSDMTLSGSGGEVLHSNAPDIRQDDEGTVATFYFARVPPQHTYSMELHWREPPRAACPTAKWTSLLGQFSVI